MPKYFAINKDRQYGKTTILFALSQYLKGDYEVIKLDFLSQLRGYYMHRKKRPTLQSVILAGVYDIKNLKIKMRPDKEHKVNSPWNIVADFDV